MATKVTGNVQQNFIIFYMNSKTFVSTVNKLAPKANDFSHLNRPQEYIKLIIKKFTIREKKHQTSYNNELFAFINNYDLADFEIRGMTFLDKLKVQEGFLMFGKYDEYELQVSRDNYSIVLTDPMQENQIIMACACDGDHFLDALLLVIKYTSDSVKGMVDLDSVNKSELSDTMALAAGGNKFLRFYQFVMGI